MATKKRSTANSPSNKKRKTPSAKKTTKKTSSITPKKKNTVNKSSIKKTTEINNKETVSLSEIEDALNTISRIDRNRTKSTNVTNNSNIAVKKVKKLKLKKPKFLKELLNTNKTTKKKKSHPSIFVLFVILIVFVAIISQLDVDFSKKDNIISTKKAREEEKQEETRNLEEEFEKCLSDSKNEVSTELLQSKVDEVNNYIRNYDARVIYEDINTGYTYKYRENDSLYGASLIKLVDALYLVDNNIDLNQTKTYTSSYKETSSYGMQIEKLNTEVSLKNLMKYAITLSDNSAHQMLVSFIGRNNLKEYGRSLGAQHTLEGPDNFGNQTASDMIIYLKKAYELFETKPNGQLLKSYMMNYYQNNLNLEDINNVAHKYGSYGSFYHDAGIVFEENPYYIVVLTESGDHNFTAIQNISKKINELHHTYQSELANYCKNIVYKE